MLNKLIYIANSLDEKGFKKEADALDGIIKKSFYFFYTKCEDCGGERDVSEPHCKRCEKKRMSKKASREYGSNLEMLDDAISILNALRMEMDPDFGPELGGEEPPDEFYDRMLRNREEEEEGRALMEDARLRKDFDLD